MTTAQYAIAAPRAHLPGALHVPPFSIIAVMTALALGANQWAHLRWQIPVYALIWLPALWCALILVYATVREKPVMREMGIYLSFWFFYPLFATQLTYIAARINFPLQDVVFIRFDAALGFHWAMWMKFELGHPLLLAVQRFAYGSSYWQPLIYIPILALFGPRGRNGEFLTSILLGLSATILVYMFLPTIGPADVAGIKAQQGEIIRALRAGSNGPYPYFGIVSFPSFHTAMALLFIAAHRGNRFTFPVVLILNLVMLSAVPYVGDHYLSDMIAGAVIAAIAFVAARRLYRGLNTAL